MSEARPSPAAGVKRLGLTAAVVLTAGNMIGSGVYLLQATLGAVGSITLISWLVASGGALMLAGSPVPRLMLHARSLKFPHPDGGERRVEAPLPEDFQAALDRAGLRLPDPQG